jgi:hypothetical protein
VYNLYGWWRSNVLNFIVEVPGSNLGLDTVCFFFLVIRSPAGNCQDSSSICTRPIFFQNSLQFIRNCIIRRHTVKRC